MRFQASGFWLLASGVRLSDGAGLTPIRFAFRLDAVLRGLAHLRIVALLAFVAVCSYALAQTADPAWLRYDVMKKSSSGLPQTIAIVGKGEVLRTAGSELVRALGTKPSRQGGVAALPAKNALVLGRWKDVHPFFPELKPPQALADDGFCLKTVQRKNGKYWLIVATNDRGVLYGTFTLLRLVAQKKMSLRWTLFRIHQPQSAGQASGTTWTAASSADTRDDPFSSRWQSPRGSDTRGEYARLLASVGIKPARSTTSMLIRKILRQDFMPQLARVADAFRPWGVRLAISLTSAAQKLWRTRARSIHLIRKWRPGGSKRWTEFTS